MPDTNRPPIYFWMFVIFALIWNLMGVYQFYLVATFTPETLAEMSAEEAALYENVPIWVMIAFSFAVFGGTAGCIALLWKKAMAHSLFIASMVGIVIQMFYNLVVSDALEVYGPGGLIMPIMILLVGILLIWLAKKAQSKGWVS